MILGTHRYHDRTDAGQVLARQLAHYASRVDTLILAVPGGGVPVALEVAAYLNAPLDAFVVGRIMLPDSPEPALGAVAPGGVSVLDDEVIEHAGVTADQIAEMTAREAAERARREDYFRGRRTPPRVAGRVVILIDEALTAGLAMHAAVIALHRQEPAWLVVAAPVGSSDACEELAQEVHEVVCPYRPEPFQSVGLWYDHFSPTRDDEIRAVLRRSAGLPRA